MPPWDSKNSTKKSLILSSLRGTGTLDCGTDSFELGISYQTLVRIGMFKTSSGSLSMCKVISISARFALRMSGNLAFKKQSMVKLIVYMFSRI
jgi:hypothetical protein